MFFYPRMLAKQLIPENPPPPLNKTQHKRTLLPHFRRKFIDMQLQSPQKLIFIERSQRMPEGKFFLQTGFRKILHIRDPMNLPDNGVYAFFQLPHRVCAESLGKLLERILLLRGECIKMFPPYHFFFFLRYLQSKRLPKSQIVQSR